MTDIKLLQLHSNSRNHLTVCNQTRKKIEWLVLDRNTWNHLTVKKNELRFKNFIRKKYSHTMCI